VKQFDKILKKSSLPLGIISIVLGYIEAVKQLLSLPTLVFMSLGYSLVSFFLITIFIEKVPSSINNAQMTHKYSQRVRYLSLIIFLLFTVGLLSGVIWSIKKSTSSSLSFITVEFLQSRHELLVLNLSRTPNKDSLFKDAVSLTYHLINRTEKHIIINKIELETLAGTQLDMKASLIAPKYKTGLHIVNYQNQRLFGKDSVIVLKPKECEIITSLFKSINYASIFRLKIYFIYSESGKIQNIFSDEYYFITPFNVKTMNKKELQKSNIKVRNKNLTAEALTKLKRK
jgi:hypothetical protein